MSGTARGRRWGLRAAPVVLALGLLVPLLASCDVAVPQGSGRNFLGTGTLIVGGQRENFSLSIGGYCMRREYGEYLTSYGDNDGGGAGTAAGATDDTPDTSCLPADEGGPSYVRHNPTYRGGGYAFAVDFPDGVAGSYNVQIYSPAPCQQGFMNESLDGNTAQATRFTLLDPAGATVQSTTYTAGTSCLAWVTLASITPSAGRYLISVQAVVPTRKDQGEQNNDFALRVSSPTADYCTSDPGDVAAVTFDTLCPRISAVNEMGRYTAIPSGATTSYLLSNVDASHAGQTMDVSLFDAAEGAQSVSLLDPNGNLVPFVAEIACQDGTYSSQTGAPCATGEEAPTPSNGQTYGPWPVATSFDLCGPKLNCGRNAEGGGSTADAATQPWGFPHMVQRTQYSDRLIRLTTQLPSNYAAVYGTKTAWRLALTSFPSGSFSDRSTVWVSVRA